MSLQGPKVLVAIELSKKNWKLGLGDGSHERVRSVTARDVRGVLKEVVLAKEKWGLAADTPAVLGYEAGRDGFWVKRALEAEGYGCHMMDSSSIEVSRQARQNKTDRLDALRLLRLLVRRELHGEVGSFGQVTMPSEEQEEQMRLHRERERLVKESSGHRARMKSLCALQGVELKSPLRTVLSGLRDWAGRPLRPQMLEELEREQQRLRMVEEQLTGLERQQKAAVATGETEAARKAKKLAQLKGVGLQSSYTLAQECFGWRRFANRKQIGSFAGLTGMPFDSGQQRREQGISKAGNARVRTTMIELAWGWLRYQPSSVLSHWFLDTYVNGGGRRCRRKGIVALARKLLVALWKFVEQNQLPQGAVLKACAS